MIHQGTVTLETERLILRRFMPDDTEAVFRNWASDPEVTRFLRWPAHTEIAITQEFLTREIERYNSGDFYSWGIELKADKRLIGTIGAVGIREDLGIIQIGYCIGKAWWHKNYTSEALRRLIPFFFEEVKANRIESNHDPRNPNSGKVMHKAGLKYEGTLRGADYNNQGICDASYYAILADDFFGNAQKDDESAALNITTIKTSADLMFYNLRIAMDTVDWNANICGAPAWRYVYHTLHSADKFFINPSSWLAADEPAFHAHLLDWPDTPTDTVLSKEVLYAYFDKVRQKIIGYLENLSDGQLSECPGGKLSRLGLILAQFRHMYAHVGILNGITIAYAQQYPLICNEGTWLSGRLPEGLYDVEERH